VVRAPAGGVADGVVDRRCRRNSSAASPQEEEDRSGGCSTYSALAGGGSVSPDLGAELGESGCTAVAVAPAPDGADAHASDEPVASGGTERRAALQEEARGRARTAAT